MELFNQEFFSHLVILLGLMFGFTMFKIANCKPFKKDGEEFSWKELWLGSARNVLVIFGTVVVFAASAAFGKDLFLIQMGETQVTLQSAIDLTTLTILAVYGVKYIKNLAEYAGVGNKAEQFAPVEYIPDENYGTNEEAKG